MSGLAALVCFAAGAWVAFSDGAGGVAVAVLLWTAGLAMAGLSLGRPAASPASETADEDAGDDDLVASARRELALAERLGLGPLAGVVGGAAVAAAVWFVAATGTGGLLGVDVASDGGVPGLGWRLWTGALWGGAFGCLYHRIPGRSAVTRGLVFSLIPAAWALLVEYPLLRGEGWAGTALGELTFVLVILFSLVWGGSAGALFQWAELTSEGSLDRPLGSASP